MNSFSSAIDHGRELIGLILVDHSHMTKFSGPSNQGFKRVSATLIRWLSNLKALAESETVEMATSELHPV